MVQLLIAAAKPISNRFFLLLATKAKKDLDSY